MEVISCFPILALLLYTTQYMCSCEFQSSHKPITTLNIHFCIELSNYAKSVPMNEEDRKELQRSELPEYDIKEEPDVLKEGQLEKVQILSSSFEESKSYAEIVWNWMKWLPLTTIFAHFLLLFNQLMFGGFAVLGNMSITHFNMILFSCLRTIIMSAAIFPVALLIDWKYTFRPETDKITLKQCFLAKIPTAKDALLIVTLGIVLLICIMTYVTAVGLAPYTILAIIQPCTTVFTCLLSILLKREAKSVLKIVGVSFAVVGSMSMLVIMALTDNTVNEDNSGSLLGLTFNVKTLMGSLIILVNTLMTAVYLTLQRIALDRKIPPFTLTSYSLFVAAVISMFISFFFIKGFHPSQIPRIGWIGLIYSGIAIGSLNFSLTAYASKHTSPTVVSVYGTTAPIISTIFLYVFLHQTTTWLASLGAILITSGVFMVGYAKWKESAPASPSEINDNKPDKDIEKDQLLENQMSIQLEDIEKEETTNEELPADQV